ncbi:MAG: hypothetical protein Q9173_002197 [Seirophora scorigena]
MAKSKPIGLAWRSSTLFIVSTVGIGLFTDLFLYGLVVPILPFILQDRVNLPKDQVQGHVSALLAAYAGASVLFSPPAGIIADRVATRQAPFLIGLVALLGATIMLSLGQSVPVLIVARVLQGTSAAVVWTIGLALVLDTVGPNNLGKTIGSIFGFISIGELAAPVLGGVIYKKAGYPGVFGMAFAILAVDFIMRLMLIEKKVAAQWDVAEEPGDDGEEHEGNAGEEEDANEEEPLLRKKEEGNYKVPEGQNKVVKGYPILFCLKDPRLLTALLLAFNQATLLAAFDATIPTQAEQLFGFDSLKSGLLFIALVLPYLLLGPVAGWMVDRYGPKPAAVLGFGYLVPVLILLRLARSGGTSQIVIFCVLLSLNGIGLAVIGSPSVVEASYVVQRYDKANPDFFGKHGPYAQLYGINSMVFSLGLTLGPLISGGLRESIGYGNMNAAIGMLCLVTSLLSFIFVGGKPRALRRRPPDSTMSALSTRVYGGVTVPNTPLITKALDLAKAHMKEPLYNHVVRSWLFGFIIADKAPPLQSRDREVHAIAAILHDLGWSTTPELVSADKRFEVDGADDARAFLQREAGDRFDVHRLQLVWDSIALHTTPSIALHKEPEVVATLFGIMTDFRGVEGAPMGLVTREEFNAVVRVAPRAGFKDGFRDVLTGLCRTKPDTTSDNFVADWGVKYVKGYSEDLAAHRTISLSGTGTGDVGLKAGSTNFFLMWI